MAVAIASAVEGADGGGARVLGEAAEVAAPMAETAPPGAAAVAVREAEIGRPRQ